MKRLPEAFRSANLFEAGIGHVVVSRFKADGRVESGCFLLDVFCLGVKDALFHRFDSAPQYEEVLLRGVFRTEGSIALTPNAGRKLVESAVAYAARFGFAPGADYKRACRVFGGISTSACDEQFAFGKDGKPFFVQGPSESPARCQQILSTLESRCGTGNYHYIIAADYFDEFADPEQFDESWLVDAPRDGAADMTTKLGAMAERLRAEHPGMQVQVNRAGRRKVSDMIATLAEPVLQDAADFKTRQVVVNLAALAWNFRLLGPDKQKEMLDDLAELLSEPEVAAMFAFFVNRAGELFPGEGASVCRLETEPAPDGDIALRVASAGS
jgi:hypothetical protein